MTTKIAFIGIGNMGRNMCGQLVKSGNYDVTVHDAFKEPQWAELQKLDMVKGAPAQPKWADTPQDCVRDAELVFFSLNGPKDVRQVVYGKAEEGSFAGGEKTQAPLLPALKKGAVVCDMSTNDPLLSKQLEKDFNAAGVQFCDTPVSGGVVGARRATLAVMCGGKQEAFDKAVPALKLIAGQDRLFHCGDAGTGNIAKLVNNQLAFINMMGVTEALVLGAKAGIDPMVLREVVKASSGDSGSWRGAGQAVLQDKVNTPSFTVNLATKDITLAQQLATDIGSPAPVGAFVKTLLEQHQSNGFAAEDILATVKAVEKNSNFQVRGLWKAEPKSKL